MIKKVYKFNESNKYTGTFVLDNTDRSPVSGAWQIPAGCTEVEPPAAKEGYEIIWNGTGWEYKQAEKEAEPEQPKEPTLDELKASKVIELKAARDAAEVEPVAYNWQIYDFDDKSRARLDIALKALQLQGDTAIIDWTMADNTTATISANDILQVFVAAAVRSNKLHQQYRSLKEQVNAATSKEELDKINA